MAKFGLVHGGMHGAWCWERLIPALRSLGHECMTVDLPCEDLNAGADIYANVAVEAFKKCQDDIVIVGHSLAGLTIPLIAERRKVSRLIFLCALIPTPGLSNMQMREIHPTMLHSAASNANYDDTGGHTRTQQQAIAAFYHDVAPAYALKAVERLRSQAARPATEISPLRSWPSTARTYIYAEDDHCINATWVRENIPKILNVTPLAIPGGHSPFLARPKELAHLLDLAVSNA